MLLVKKVTYNNSTCTLFLILEKNGTVILDEVTKPVNATDISDDVIESYRQDVENDWRAFLNNNELTEEEVDINKEVDDRLLSK